jgi:hypothetical protein
MIAFEHQGVTSVQGSTDMSGNPAGVRQQPETVFSVREHELAGLARIVGDGKGPYLEIAQADACLPVETVDRGRTSSACDACRR